MNIRKIVVNTPSKVTVTERQQKIGKQLEAATSRAPNKPVGWEGRTSPESSSCLETLL